ncbi:MAG: hypothetical protein Q4E24_16645 [bacterium]|nr:hypothetical protein [bacterium]
MTRKRSKLLTFFFSLLPGAGEMFLGFLKQGASIMMLFFGLIAVSSFLNFGSLLYFAPVIWFYSFFNANNLNSLPDDEFYALEDDFIIHLDELYRRYGYLFRKYQALWAFGLILVGVSIIWNQVLSLGELFHIPQAIIRFLRYTTGRMPQMIVAVAIILLGISLIRAKKDDVSEI